LQVRVDQYLDLEDSGDDYDSTSNASSEPFSAQLQYRQIPREAPQQHNFLMQQPTESLLPVRPFQGISESKKRINQILLEVKESMEPADFQSNVSLGSSLGELPLENSYVRPANLNGDSDRSDDGGISDIEDEDEGSDDDDEAWLNNVSRYGATSHGFDNDVADIVTKRNGDITDNTGSQSVDLNESDVFSSTDDMQRFIMDRINKHLSNSFSRGGQGSIKREDVGTNESQSSDGKDREDDSLDTSYLRTEK
jgi:hypothetical protein